ncbi:MAG TPA: sporulation protein [Propionibacterium sp.]|nr:sporulation protein [Propionibacterium sp.]
MIFVDFETPAPFVVGQEVFGVVTWDPGQVTRARAFEISVGWRTEGRGDRDRRVIGVQTFPFTRGQPTTATKFPFRFVLPPDGPVTYHGHLLRIIWSVNTRVDIGWALDPRESHEFVVSPRLL